jgi:SAM-dependent methyltransferase
MKIDYTNQRFKFASGFTQWLRSLQRKHRLQLQPTGTIDFGGLRRLIPVSRVFGLDRGLPIDRYYIEKFLSSYSDDIKGHVLEIGDNYYTKKFGNDRVTKSDILHVVNGNPKATIVADLTNADNIYSNSFDCIIFTQTLQMIYDVDSAMKQLHRILKPDGLLLVTTHGISKIGRREGKDKWGEYWHFTSQSISKIFLKYFLSNNLKIEVYGNVLSAISFLHGLATSELSRDELDYLDPDYEVIISIRATKTEQDKQQITDR